MNPTPSPRLVITILSWDSIRDTLTCLEAARRNDYPNFQILVVDNANQPSLATILARDYPEVHLLQNSTNLGYAGGHNVGFRWALAQGAAFILLLNDDLSIEPDTCRHLVTAAIQNPNLAAVGCKIRPAGKPGLLWAVGEAFPREAPLQLDEGQFDSPHPVRYVVGCCILLRCTALEQLGLFDEAYFMLHEEKDWCTRAVRAGFQNWYTPDAVAWHDLEDTLTSHWSPTYHYLYVRNNLYFWQKHAKNAIGWQRFLQAIAYGWQEIIFIRHYGNQPVRSARAACRGALDFLSGRLGSPPEGL